MSAPPLLLVDDSEAILAYEQAALSSRYAISTATTGADALEKARLVRPVAILLDLSMPGMDGDEVVDRLKADAELCDIPVIIVSTERERAEACLQKGADAFLPKPLRADDLVATVGRVLDDANRRRRRGSLAVLGMSVGGLELGVELARVRAVLLMPATRPLPTGPFYMTRMIELHGEPVAVLDLALRLGVSHERPLVERQLVIVAHDAGVLALAVDRVHEPVEVPPASVIAKERLGVAGHRPIGEALVAVVMQPDGPVPILDPRVFLSQRALADVGALLDRAALSARLSAAEAP